MRKGGERASVKEDKARTKQTKDWQKRRRRMGVWEVINRREKGNVGECRLAGWPTESAVTWANQQGTGTGEDNKETQQE